MIRFAPKERDLLILSRDSFAQTPFSARRFVRAVRSHSDLANRLEMQTTGGVPG